LDYFPIFIDLHDKKVLVVGQYRVLEFKMQKLIESGAKVIYVSHQSSEKVSNLFKEGKITFHQDEFNEKYLEDIWLVVCGSDDEELKARLAGLTSGRNIFCNFVDEAPISSFISPAVISKSDLTIAISTKGKSPALNKYLKNEILDKIGDEYIDLMELLGKIRQKVIDHIPGQKHRSDLFDSIIQHPDVLKLIRGKKHSKAEQLVKDIIDREIKKPKFDAG